MKMKTKKELLNELAARAHVKNVEAKGLLESLLSIMAEELASTGEFRLDTIGTFKTKEVPARTGRNPATGEAIEIPAKTRVVFKAAKALGDFLNNNQAQPKF